MSDRASRSAPVLCRLPPLCASQPVSFGFLLMFRSGPAPPVEFCRKAIETGLPHRTVAHHPLVEVAERLGPKRVKSPPALRPNDHELRVLQDGELPRDARLPDLDGADQLANGALAAPQRLDEAASGWVGQDLEGVG